MIAVDPQLLFGFGTVLVCGIAAGALLTYGAMSFGCRFAISFPQMDGRSWISVACFVLVLVMLLMMWADRSLLRDDFFKTLATALIITAWLNGPVGWAFQATKAGGELADQNAKLVGDKLAASPPVTDKPLDLGAWGTSLIAEIAAAKEIATLDALEAEHAPNIDAAPPNVAKALQEAFAARRKALTDQPGDQP